MEIKPADLHDPVKFMKSTTVHVYARDFVPGVLAGHESISPQPPSRPVTVPPGIFGEIYIPPILSRGRIYVQWQYMGTNLFVVHSDEQTTNIVILTPEFLLKTIHDMRVAIAQHPKDRKSLARVFMETQWLDNNRGETLRAEMDSKMEENKG